MELVWPEQEELGKEVSTEDWTGSDTFCAENE